MLGAQAVDAAQNEADKASKEFDRWSDDETQVKEKEFDVWSEASVEAADVEIADEQDAELPFVTDTEPDPSMLGVSSKHSAPHPNGPKEVEAPRLSPRPPKAPPPAHLLRKAARPVPPPPRQPLATAQVPRPMLRVQPMHPIHVPVLLVPMSTAVPWSCFVSLQHGAERMKLLGTLLLGDATAAQALVQDASANFKLSHRTHFDDVKKAALKAVLQLVPMTDKKDQEARDALEKYLLSKDRAGVVRVGIRDLYLIPPSKAEDCGLKVRPPLKSIVAAVAEKIRSKKPKNEAKKKKAEEVVVADDTEGSEADKKDDREKDDTDDRKDDEAEIVEDVEAFLGLAMKQKEEAEDEDKEPNEDERTEKSEEGKAVEVKEDEKKDEKVPEESKETVAEDVKEDAKKNDSKVLSPFANLTPQAQAKPRFSRLDVENAAFELARSARRRDDRPVRHEIPRGPGGPRQWPAFPRPEPWWNPYVTPQPGNPPVGVGPPDHERRKRRRSSKERRRTRRKSKTVEASDASSSSRASEAASFRNPYVDPDVSTRQPEEAKAKEAAEDDGTSTDAKWKGLLARVEALAEFCRADEDG